MNTRNFPVTTIAELEVRLTFQTDQQYRQLSGIMNLLNADVLNVHSMGEIRFDGPAVRVTFMAPQIVQPSNWLAIEKWCGGHGIQAKRIATV